MVMLCDLAIRQACGIAVGVCRHLHTIWESSQDRAVGDACGGWACVFHNRPFPANARLLPVGAKVRVI